MCSKSQYSFLFWDDSNLRQPPFRDLGYQLFLCASVIFSFPCCPSLVSLKARKFTAHPSSFLPLIITSLLPEVGSHE